MTTVNRDQVKQMIDEEAVTLVEVLDEDQFNKFHLPGALNVPVSGDFESGIKDAVPDVHEPVVVYCYDEKCDASPKAMKEMEKLGYDRVYDYEAGKVDWKEAGFPIES